VSGPEEVLVYLGTQETKLLTCCEKTGLVDWIKVLKR